MASSLDESKDCRDAENKKIAFIVHQTPFLEESRQYHTAAQGDGDGAWIGDLPTLAIPTMGVDQMPASVNLTALYEPPPTADNIALSEQPTWVMPALRDPTKVPKPVVQDTGVESYVSILLNLVKSSGIYALASLAAPLISLVLAPFLTRYLSHSDYGALVILNTIIALVAGVTQLGLYDAFIPVYRYDYESQSDRLGVLSTIVILLWLFTIPTAIVAIAVAPWLAAFLLNAPSLSDSVRVAAMVILMQNLTLPGFSWLRAENRAVLFSTLSIANLLVTLGANIFLVGVLQLGIVGSLIGTGSGYAVVVVCTLPIILLRAGIHLRFDIARGFLAFGLPHVVNFVSGWVLQLVDRYLLGHLASLSQTASYAVAYSLGGVLSGFIIAPFSLAWWSLMFTIAKRDDAAHIFQLVFRWFSIILLFATFGLSLFGTRVLKIVFPPTYYSAAAIIPIIATSIMLNGVYVVLSVGISLQRKTWLASIFITCSALLNASLNIILIPSYGAMGAAVATLIAYAMLAVSTYIANQRIYPVPFEIGRFSIALMGGIVLYTGSDFLAYAQGKYVAWGIYIGALILYGGCLLLLGVHPSRRGLLPSR